MKRLCIFSILVLSSVVSHGGDSRKSGFVIDPKRPYIDIVFSRVGERHPVWPGESKHGLWLVLRNNCIYPIRVRLLNRSNENPGRLLAHEVFSIAGRFSTPAPPGSLTANPALTQPQGYPVGDVVNAAEVLPSHELLFSVPLENVSRNWAIRIEVDLEIPRPKTGIQPRTLVEFGFSELSPEAQHLSDQMLAGTLR